MWKWIALLMLVCAFGFVTVGCNNEGETEGDGEPTAAEEGAATDENAEGDADEEPGS